MESQLPLQLVQPLRYSSNTYLVHRGVADVVTSLVTLAYQRVFSLAYVQGPPRSGKTHTAVYLVGHLQEERKPARLIASDEVASWYESEFHSQPLRNGETVVLDDGDLLLEELSRKNQSGIFMDLTEKLSQVDGTLVVLGSSSPEKIECTKQIRSRLNSGLHLVLEGPADDELDSLLNFITKQRGLQLSDSKRGYLLRRVARTLPALVECVEKVEETGDFTSSSTSFTVLAEAVSHETDNRPLFDRKKV
jgi:chromosomal replication initiation ATPase DnaA